MKEKPKQETKREFQCACGKDYLSYAALFTHIKIKHSGIPPGKIIKPPPLRGRGRPKHSRAEELESSQQVSPSNSSSASLDQRKQEFFSPLVIKSSADFSGKKKEAIQKYESEINKLPQKMEELFTSMEDSGCLRQKIVDKIKVYHLLKQTQQKTAPKKFTVARMIITFLSSICSKLKPESKLQITTLLILALDYGFRQCSFLLELDMCEFVPLLQQYLSQQLQKDKKEHQLYDVHIFQQPFPTYVTLYMLSWVGCLTSLSDLHVTIKFQ